ncbi:hypothetical protein [Desulfosporosinus sp. OT]|uniref:hypothetical protein n=1 Tax=Desulfosporosinus sp. OT TaxID=913865 RepID=UPI000223AB9E|nr:hypothetical protein [Desulfosporosinus sp. OT]EGW41131.1 hypothetical protein DOT_0928 [Desulfosporosinus sp. OT]
MQPGPRVQEEAVKSSYEALRYIDSPTHKAELLAVKNNERAILIAVVSIKIATLCP